MRFRLITKMTIITSLVLLVVMGLFAYITVNTLKKMCLEEVVKDTENLSETILRTTYHLMLDNDRKGLSRVIEEVSTQKDIERIRLFNKEGVISFSTESGEVGMTVDKNAEGCNSCHLSEKPLTDVSSMSRSRIYTRQGRKVLAMTKEILNETGCYLADCHFHSKEAEINGILDVHVSLEGMLSRSDSFRNEIVAFTFFLLFILSLSLTHLTQKLVNEPVNRLLEHTKKVASGEFESRIDGIPGDELGELEEAFNEMTLKLKKAHLDLREWAGTLETKVDERTEEIRQIQSKLMRSEKLASLGELVAGIAHEINNPLTSIMIFSSIVLKNPMLDPQLKSDLEMILRQTQRCAEIVGRLLEFGRETVPQRKQESVNRVMDRTLALVERQASFQDIAIIKEYEEDIPDVFIDPGQIKQVFMNMLINASQAMPHGGRLTLKTGRVEENVYIVISDTGSGIAEENLKKIFDPFFTTKDHDGTGLGLSVSYGIIENHRGEIEVFSAVGEGTTFTIRLPIRHDEEPAEEV